MAPDKPSTVWILGAGFSRSLGAPLFKDLFRSNHLVKAACGVGSAPVDMIEVLQHYLRHAPEALGGAARDHGLFWHDPEEFLDVIESASAGATPAVNMLKTDLHNVTTETLVNMGRRALAIECSHFLRNADLQTERWLPYVMWAHRLSKADTVITFNYDRIPELLSVNSKHVLKPMLDVVVPSDEHISIRIGTIRAQSCAPVLKLHGSVNWVAREGRIDAVDPPNDDLALTCNGNDLVLAVPGPGKIGIRDKYKQMAILWATARAAIEEAAKIVFVGYRFPQTDASARTEILLRIKEAFDKDKLKTVQIILGPNEGDPDVVRMKTLLTFVCPGIVDVLPLYAEDFLAMPREWTAAPAPAAPAAGGGA